MFPKHLPLTLSALVIAAVVAMPAGAQTVTIKEDFTGTTTTNTWLSFNGACLTAGTGSDQSHLPGCLKDNYYQSQLQYGGANGYLGTTSGGTVPSGAAGQNPDPSGSGALRLTNGSALGGGFANGYAQNGAILSTFNFPSNKGIQITFKTVTYGGDSGGAANDGADGITFFLLDDSVVTQSWNTPLDSGAFGGSLGYTCSNTNYDPTIRSDGSVRGYDGVIGGYIGLGVDEFGNYLNPGDNTASGPNYTPNRIGLRGAGGIAWKWLTNKYPDAYLSTGSNAWTTSQQAAAVNNTCKSGYLRDYNGNYFKNPTVNGTTSGQQSDGQTVSDYPMITDASGNGAYKVLSGVKIAKEASASNGVETPVTRTQAKPITYNLQITQANKLSFSYSYNGGAWQPVITSVDITNSNGTLPANVRFGFAGSDGGSSNIHEILCFAAQPVESSGTSGGINVYQNPTIRSGTQLFLANYFPSSWTGQMTAQTIGYNTTSQTLVANTVPNWDARCVLTGVDPSTGKCDTTGATSPSAEAWQQGSIGTARQMITWDGVANTGVPFEWSSSSTGAISAAMQTTIGSQARLNFLRGDRTNEIGNTSGSQTFRTRLSVLGDIVDSSPTWVGPPQSYTNMNTWVDSIYGPSSSHPVTAPENSGQTYSAFQAKYTATLNFNTSAATSSDHAGRVNAVYVGANDGFLHGFRAGSLDYYGNLVTNYSSIPNDGYEVVAYMPGPVFQGIHNTSQTELDFSNPQYSHNWYVDATPGTGDLFYQSSNTSSPNYTSSGGSWHTWLVGGLGAGGKGIYAIDVTDPTYFTEGNASSLVIGEWTATATTTTTNGTTTTTWTSNITCAATSTNSTTACGANYLGNTYGTPLIRRFHNGQWGVIFGNGYGSQSGTAGIFIMLINPSNGAQTFYYLPVSSTTTNNGIGAVSSSDIDLDHVIDYIYAGDLQGNLWRFDVTSYDPTQWAVSATSPLFKTPNGQPITSRVTVSSMRTIQTTFSLTGSAISNMPVRMMINFGTGQQIPQTLTTATQYATGTQTLYGIWDWDMAHWNTLSSGQQAIDLVNGATGPQPISTTNLVPQTFTTTTSGGLTYRNVATPANAVCWPSSSFPVEPNNPANPSSCTSANNYGWYMNLTTSTTNGQSTYEQVIFDPVISPDGMFVVNTYIPAQNSPLNCTPGTSTGFTMALEPTSGAGAPALNGGSGSGYFILNNGTLVDGLMTNGVGTPSFISDGGAANGDPSNKEYMITQTPSGMATSGVNRNPVVTAQRLNWIERR